jgi:Domain of unknown function (DUF4157)
MTEREMLVMRHRPQASHPVASGLVSRCGAGGCASRATPAIAPPIVREVVRSAGQPLNAAARDFFEPRFGHDFGRVRVHTDARAAQSARAIDAVAYTVGNHIAFDTGHPLVRSPQGPSLLAHELTHVVQQRGEARDSQALTVDVVDSAAEREAAQTGQRLERGGSPGAVKAEAGGGLVQRALSDVLAGGAVGAIAGAFVGSFFGPIGALIGAGIGLLGGLAVGEVAGAQRRGLTSTEQAEATKVFGTSLDMSQVKIAESSVMAVGGFARTPRDTIYFPPGTSRMAFSDFMPWLIHELTHVWQYQHGISVAEKLWWALHGRSAYDYGGEAGLRTAALANKRFLDFNTEQQASIAEDFYKAQRDGRDTSAYQPYIAQLQAGGARAATSAPPVTPPAAAPSGGGP